MTKFRCKQGAYEKTIQAIDAKQAALLMVHWFLVETGYAYRVDTTVTVEWEGGSGKYMVRMPSGFVKKLGG